MKLQYKNGEEFFLKYNQFFHLVIALSLLPFGLIWLAKKKGFEIVLPSETVAYVIYAVLGSLIVLLFIRAMRGYKASFKDFAKEWTLREKLDFFYASNFKKYIGLGVATLIAVAGYLVDTSYFFIFAYVLLLFSMSIGRPAERKIEKELALSKEEIEEFRKAKEIQ